LSTAERIERRLTAILAADVVGYSRLMSADEEGTLAQLKGHRSALVDPKIAENRGRIVKTAGDGLLVEFASVVDALRCAVEVQRGMAERDADVPQDKRIEFRVGIHQGDVIAEAGDIFGDGVNVAARLEALAEPGGICVSGRVQEDAAHGKLDVSFEDMGEQQLKNISRSIRVYRVVPNGPAGVLEKKSSGFLSRGWKVIGLRRAGMALVAALLVLFGAAYWRFQRSEPQSLPAHRLSMVVLPFKNLSNEPEQEYLRGRHHG
jgi:adenylate cyclase